jgi:hypothetical protein
MQNRNISTSMFFFEALAHLCEEEERLRWQFQISLNFLKSIFKI